MTALPSLPERPTLTSTRLSLHAVAEHVLAAARFEGEGRIGLHATPGGFGTPTYERAGQVESLAVIGCALRVQRGDDESTTPITTINAAARAAALTPGAPADVYHPSTSPDFDEQLPLDEAAASSLAAWFELAWSVLGELATSHPDDTPSTRTLWPEHFDAAIDLGDEERGGRGTFGASAGDAEHPEPYLYVTHWADVTEHAFWNDTAFPGASLGYQEIRAADDPARVALDFYRRGRDALNAGRG